jgi:hypothetical protein
MIICIVLFIQESPPYERPKRNPKSESEKWPSESSGIYTGSIQSREESTAELDLKKEVPLVGAAAGSTRFVFLPSNFLKPQS